jgi:hypothetical protein
MADTTTFYSARRFAHYQTVFLVRATDFYRFSETPWLVCRCWGAAVPVRKHPLPEGGALRTVRDRYRSGL